MKPSAPVEPLSPVPTELDDARLYIHRDLSLLSFFKRVLAMGGDERVPLLERLRFLTICSTITDEFFEIRVAGVKQRLQLGMSRQRPDKLSPQEVLKRIRETLLGMVTEQYRLLNEEVLPALRDRDIRILKRADWSKKQKKWLRGHFTEQVAPVLTPVGLDLAHPFPRVLNKSLNMIVSLEGTDAFGRRSEYAVVPVPRCLPRIIKIPTEIGEGGHDFVMLSSVIHAHVDQVFPGMKIRGCHQFRVTRNADLWVEEEEVDDLLDALKYELFRRRYGDGVRLEVAQNCPQAEVDLLREQFDLGESDVYRVDGPVNLHRLEKIISMVDRPDLKFPGFVPAVPQMFASGDMFDLLSRQDVLLHHPYESFAPVVNFVRQAADDPAVLAIKQTVYRTGEKSPMVAALIKAALSGKEVTAVIELRARFDEEANIDLATQLQDAGAHVVYGIVGYKTHAKMLLVVRREGGHLRRYAHLGTGNYHTGTARLYTDFSFMTSRTDVTTDVHRLFTQLTGLGRAEQLDALLQAPFTLRDGMLNFIDAECEAARQGKDARIILKVNSISDPVLIRALFRASQAGVSVDLIVRGICCLRPGVPGVSENIRVRSVVGRLLEHSRVYYFYAGGEEKVFLASADWMIRNLYHRVETCFPIEDAKLKKRIIHESIDTYLDHDGGAWESTSSGDYLPIVTSDDTQESPQSVLISELADT